MDKKSRRSQRAEVTTTFEPRFLIYKIVKEVLSNLDASFYKIPDSIFIFNLLKVIQVRRLPLVIWL